ncbi:carbohydrate esterase family 16 protein [Calocera cornea HHB12733]|uniref:Carbohydrate esterase family 16 protein n=1 Tax=Calocera cornea HHB12733 TaxID=1353952 RepID=A0A165JA12_9BASI|nr:carbohydrate esterase family 16 protein [Calocera cornea HHB12733]
MLLSAVLVGLLPLAHALTWNNTEYMFVFGDSYSTTGYNVSAGITSPDPGYTASNGLNWVEYLRGTYNVTYTKVYNLAYGGATTDSYLVTPYLPTVQSLVNQVTLWDQYFSPAPSVAPWTTNNTLFAIFIGINDVGNAWNTNNLNETQPVFFSLLMDRYFQQVNNLYERGARNFLFLNVPPIDRAPLFIEQGSATQAAVKSALALYNTYLTDRINALQYLYPYLGSVVVYDTNTLFNTLLDNAETFSFTNITGYCDAYANGTPTTTYQTAGCEPVSTYFWLNTLHPLWFVHDVVAHGISRALS